MRRIDTLLDRVVHPERYPEGPRSGLGGAIRARLGPTHRRNQSVADALAEGFRREHPQSDEPDPQPTREELDALAADALGRLIGRRPKSDT